MPGKGLGIDVLLRRPLTRDGKAIPRPSLPDLPPRGGEDASPPVNLHLREEFLPALALHAADYQHGAIGQGDRRRIQAAASQVWRGYEGSAFGAGRVRNEPLRSRRGSMRALGPA